MAKEFIVFRHGQTDWNLERRVQGHLDIPLNETGQKQAKALADRLKKLPIDIIYTSDLVRARDTGFAVSEKLRVDLIETKALRETHMGDVQGMLLDEAVEKYGEKLWESFRSIKREAMLARFPNGESREESMLRLRGFIDEMEENEDYQCIGISTHGGSLRSLLHTFLPEGSEPLQIPNCVAYRLIKKENNWLVEGPI